MVIFVEILFAFLIGGIGGLLLKNKNGLLGIKGVAIKKTAVGFGVWFLILTGAMLGSILIWGSAPWPVTGILIVAMLSTMVLGIIISQKMFH